jgi:hypothetical protein
MYKKIAFKLRYAQHILLIAAFIFFKIFTKKPKNSSWCVGVDEVASITYKLSRILQPSVSVCLKKHKFYKTTYTYEINLSNKFLHNLYRFFYSPVLLGYLLNSHSHFAYIGNTGFLLDRNFEFSFLKKYSKKIVCFFTGSDIRSPKLSIDFLNSLAMDSYFEYIGANNPNYLSHEYDLEKQLLASISDKYADIIFNYTVDQQSYLKKKQYPWPYMLDEKCFHRDASKFQKMSTIKILHAPSNPLIKGTPLVRAAIKKLQLQGYDFEYIELQNVTNDIVLEHLKNSHIVLNEFYSFAPGVFGVEAMAHHCCVLMSADPAIECSLPAEGTDAWRITKYWEIYEVLKDILDAPEKISFYADNGYNFTCDHYTYEAASKQIEIIMKEHHVI